jgi:hypothetical protein
MAFTKRFTGYMKRLLEPANSAEVGLQWGYERPDDERFWLIADLDKVWSGYRGHSKEPQRMTTELFYQWARAHDDIFEVRNDNHSRILIRYRSQRSKQKRVPCEQAESVVLAVVDDEDQVAPEDQPAEHNEDKDVSQPEPEQQQPQSASVDSEQMFKLLFGLEFRLAPERTPDSLPLVAKADWRTADSCVHELGDVSLRDYLLQLHNNNNEEVLCDSILFVQLLANADAFAAERRLWLGLAGGGSAHAFLYRSGVNANFVHVLVPACMRAEARLANKLRCQPQWIYGPDADGQYIGLTKQGPVWRTVDQWSLAQAAVVAAELRQRAGQCSVYDRHVVGEHADINRLHVAVDTGALKIDCWVPVPVTRPARRRHAAAAVICEEWANMADDNE